MTPTASFGTIVKERRTALDLTQSELANRVGCAQITIRRIEGGSLRPSAQMAELLALALKIPEAEQLAFVRLARKRKPETPIPKPTPTPTEIGLSDLTGRAVKGFQLGELIGSGGFGVVYKAIQPSVKRDVAVKIILPRYANMPTFIRRFETEAQLVARLEHPHIVPLYDYWREPDAAYLIMRLLKGGNLEEFLNSEPLSPLDFQRITSQICIALHSAHRIGIIHRDIKPANVLLDEDLNAYLTDFGIAKDLESQQSQVTKEGVVVGSPAYVSPEQILSEPVQQQSDIYCLGILLFELLTGQRPFTGPTPIAYLQQHLNEPLPRLSTYNSALPSNFDDVIRRATAKKPEERYSTVLDLLTDLSQGWETSVSLASSPTTTSKKPELSREELATLDNPFQGLRPFTEADTDNFYGRKALIHELLGMMADHSDLNRIIAVVGPSGSGKSSVVKAGLIPALRRGGIPNSDSWFIVDLTPSSHPWEEVEAALLRVAVNPPESLLAQLRDGPRGLNRAIQRILPEDRDTELVMIIDQFEELFTLVENETIRANFLESLVTAVLDPQSRLRLIITLRADFIDRPLQYVDFGELIRKRTVFVLPLTPHELTEAIAQPVSQLGMMIEPALVSTIIQEVGEQPGMLPLLQYALTELFEKRAGQELTLVSYEETGGVFGALARRADEIYAQLTLYEQRVAQQIFLRLVTLGEGIEDTRRRVHLYELEQLSGNEKINNRQSFIIEQYGYHRLLTFDHDPITRSATVEVAHEALLREWPRLRRWLANSREDVRQQRLLADATAQWQNAHQDSSYLLRGSRLIAFESWAEATTVALTKNERWYLEASSKARDLRHQEEDARRQRELETTQRLADEQTKRAEEQTRASSRLRVFAVGLALLALATTAFAWIANNQRVSAQNNLIASERIRLASQAQNALQSGAGGEVATLLALRSLQLGYSPEADLALQDALNVGFAKQQFTGHTGRIWSSRFTPNGRFIASSGEDKIIWLWNAQTGEEIRQFVGHTGPINIVTVSPNGEMLASISSDNTVRLWDIETGEEIAQFMGFLNGGWSVEFTPDNEQLIASDNSKAYLLDISSGELIREFIGHSASITFLTISPNGQFLATTSEDETAHLWDIRTGAEIKQFTDHVGWVGSVDFSPDGRYLLTSGADAIARIWDVASGLELRRFVGHESEIFDGRFSPDGRFILTTGYDSTARIWDVETSQEVRLIRGHTNSLSEGNFSPDGSLLVTSSADSTLRLWNVDQETEPVVFGPFGGAHTLSQTMTNLSPDRKYTLIGRLQGNIELWDNATSAIMFQTQLPGQSIEQGMIATNNQHFYITGNDGIIREWHIQTQAETQQFVGHEGPIKSLDLTKDDILLLSAGEDGTLHIWDTTTGSQQLMIEAHATSTNHATFSPDEQQIISSGEDGFIRIWDTVTGILNQEIEQAGVSIQTAQFLPQSNQIAFSTGENIAYLWDLNANEILQTFNGHIGTINHLAISPDETLLLTGSTDQTVRVWEIATGNEIRRFGNHASSLLYADFSNDGNTIYSSATGFAYRWRTHLSDTITFACAQLGRDFNEAEREFYNLDESVTCTNRDAQLAQAAPTWTPITETPESVDAIQTVVDLEFFVLDILNITQMDIPAQNVFIETNEGVVRPVNIEAETLQQPLYTSSESIPDDYLEPPFEVGPFPMGVPLGITFDQWLSSTGTGTYQQFGAKADIDLTFDGLVTNGVYTLWCVTLTFPEFAIVEEVPCGSPDGSNNIFTADESGHANVQMQIDAFPPSTSEIIYELAIAYHSDGQTYGEVVGERGLNVHVQMVFDFLPPE